MGGAHKGFYGRGRDAQGAGDAYWNGSKHNLWKRGGILIGLQIERRRDTDKDARGNAYRNGVMPIGVPTGRRRDANRQRERCLYGRRWQYQ